MAGNRITLTLDPNFTEMVGEPWGFSKTAGALRFANYSVGSSHVGTYYYSSFVEAADVADFWKVPGLGVITLKATLDELGILSPSDGSSSAYTSDEANVQTNPDGSAGLLYMNATSTLVRSRPTGDSGPMPEFTLIDLLVTLAILAILASASGSRPLKTFWQTKEALKPNEGWAVFVQPVRTSSEANTKGYMAIAFGQKFALGIDLHGFATLYENLGSDTSPNWVARKNMDLGGVGLSLRSDFRIHCIPIGGRYLVFRFGNVTSHAFGFRPSSYDNQKSFVWDSVSEGDGNYYDSALDQNVVLPSGQLHIAIQATGSDYRITPYKRRYATDLKTCYFTSEAMPYALPGQTPTLTPYGYASGYTSGGQGTMMVDLVSGDTGTAWDSSTDTKPTAKLTMAASSDAIYPPELWYIDGEIAAQTQTTSRTPIDASADWYKIDFRKTTAPEPSSVTVKLKDDSRVLSLYRRGGPIEVDIDGTAVFSGYIDLRRPTIGPTFTDSEIEAKDFWKRLKVGAGQFVSLDGKTVGEVVNRLLLHAGFPQSQIVIDAVVNSIKFEDFTTPNALQLFAIDCTVEDALRDIISRTSIQGSDGLRVRWLGDHWHVYTAASVLPSSTADPTTVFYTTEAALPTGTATLSTDSARWGAGWFKITSHLEFHSENPEFNDITYRAVDKTDDSAGTLEFVCKPPASVVTGDTTKQEFEGLISATIIGPPTITATTILELQRQGRFHYEREQRKGLGLQVQAEWQPSIDVDQEIAVVGYLPVDPTLYSFGVFRIEEIAVEITADDVIDSITGNVVERAYLWSGAYRLHYLRATSASFNPTGSAVVPMFSTILPPASIYAS